MTTRTTIRRIRAGLSFIACYACLIGCHSSKPDPIRFDYDQSSFTKLPDGDLRVKTPYADYLLRDEFYFRTLYTIQPDGNLWVASRINLYNPADMVVPYVRYMMGANLLVTDARRALLIGVGGGSMLHFLTLHEPALRVDAVDIDSEVITLAQTWFGVSKSEWISLHTADGNQFIQNSPEATYDLIYLDAFIRPDDETDQAGIPLHLKTQSFYEKIAKIASPHGVAAFNLHRGNQTTVDIAAIKATFASVWVLDVPETTNVIVLGAKFRPENAEAALQEQLQKYKHAGILWMGPIAGEIADVKAALR